MRAAGYNAGDGQPVNRLTLTLTLASLTLHACGPSPSLWGTYSTPTPAAERTLVPALPVIPTETATQAAPPTLPFTASPTLQILNTPTTASGRTFLEPTFTPTFDVAPILYYAQSGDTLPAVASRFGVEPAEVRSDAALPPAGLIDPGRLLVIPDRIKVATTPNIQLIPDSEFIFSATALNFDLTGYINQTDGNIKNYRQYLGSTGWTTSIEAFNRLAYENSINPRLLLGVLEYESHWVLGHPTDALHTDYPMGYQNLRYKGLFTQMVWAVNQLSIGYYSWRAGTLTELDFPDGTSLRLDPRLNAGTVAVQYLFSRLHNQSEWAQMMDPQRGFLAQYTGMFGDPWEQADLVNPIFPAGLAAPVMVLPFEPNREWSLTGGPHGAWEHDGALAAIDFAPPTDHGGCSSTTSWVLAAAPGLVVRADTGVVMVDLDGDGYEQTGWDIMYLHVGSKDRVTAGTVVKTNDRLGHASCEGGISTGTHLHIARKYNGEWVPADGPLPWILSGWTVHAGAKPYEGTLTKGDQTIIADPVGQLKSVIFRDPND